MAVLITYLGYLSVGRIVIYAYLIALFAARQSYFILTTLNNAVYLNYAILAMTAGLLLFFR